MVDYGVADVVLRLASDFRELMACLRSHPMHDPGTVVRWVDVGLHLAVNQQERLMDALCLDDRCDRLLLRDFLTTRTQHAYCGRSLPVSCSARMALFELPLVFAVSNTEARAASVQDRSATRTQFGLRSTVSTPCDDKPNRWNHSAASGVQGALSAPSDDPTQCSAIVTRHVLVVVLAERGVVLTLRDGSDAYSFRDVWSLMLDPVVSSLRDACAVPAPTPRRGRFTATPTPRVQRRSPASSSATHTSTSRRRSLSRLPATSRRRWRFKHASTRMSRFRRDSGEAEAEEDVEETAEEEAEANDENDDEGVEEVEEEGAVAKVDDDDDAEETVAAAQEEELREEMVVGRNRSPSMHAARHAPTSSASAAAAFNRRTRTPSVGWVPGERAVRCDLADRPRTVEDGISVATGNRAARAQTYERRDWGHVESEDTVAHGIRDLATRPLPSLPAFAPSPTSVDTLPAPLPRPLPTITPLAGPLLVPLVSAESLATVVANRRLPSSSPCPFARSLSMPPPSALAPTTTRGPDVPAPALARCPAYPPPPVCVWMRRQTLPARTSCSPSSVSPYDVADPALGQGFGDPPPSPPLYVRRKATSELAVTLLFASVSAAVSALHPLSVIISVVADGKVSLRGGVQLSYVERHKHAMRAARWQLRRITRTLISIQALANSLGRCPYPRALDPGNQKALEEVKQRIAFASKLIGARETDADAYFAAARDAQQAYLNNIIFLLTVLEGIFLPLAFCETLYGMYFDSMPEFSWKFGYLYFWMLCVGLAVILALLFLPICCGLGIWDTVRVEATLRCRAVVGRIRSAGVRTPVRDDGAVAGARQWPRRSRASAMYLCAMADSDAESDRSVHDTSDTEPAVTSAASDGPDAARPLVRG